MLRFDIHTGAVVRCAACIAALMLARCGPGSGLTHAGASVPPPESASMARAQPIALAEAASLMRRDGAFRGSHRSRARSWGDPAARRKKALLYVSDWGKGVVEVYDYRSGSLLGEATGFELPVGMCSDKKGDVFVTDEDLSEIFEFAYGRTTPRRVISDGTGYSIGCSIDPTNGDLAVTNFFDYEGYGGVLIYKKGFGTPTQYSYAGANYYWPAGYDPSGNLFVEGSETNGSVVTGITVSEMPHGSHTFHGISVYGATIHFPNAVEWDGKFLGLGDQEFGYEPTTGIYQVSVSGSVATVVGSTGMSGTCDAGNNDVAPQWAYDSSAPDDVLKAPATQVAGSNQWCDSYFGFWKYPKSGINNPVRTLQGSDVPLSGDGQTVVVEPRR